MDQFLRLNPANADKLKKEQNQTVQLQNNKKEKEDLKAQPWVEKYRPNSLDDVVYQVSVVNALKTTKQTGKLPHLLLYGPPGTGKTSTILALAKELFGDQFRDRILELNASDERGIQVVRDKIKKYSQKLVTKLSDKNKNAPNFQIVILDEADSMTNDAQSALRRVIEDYTKTTRFCIICNYVSKIIDPIASRCAKYRFSPLTKESQFNRLKLISEKENVNVDDSLITTLIDISEGDLRRSINLLQSISQIGKNLITHQIIDDICGIIPDIEIDKILDTARFNPTNVIMKVANEFFYNGYDVRQLIVQLNEYVINHSQLSEDEKCQVVNILLESEISLMEGASPLLKLFNLMTDIRKLFTMC